METIGSIMFKAPDMLETLELIFKLPDDIFKVFEDIFVRLFLIFSCPDELFMLVTLLIKEMEFVSVIEKFPEVSSFKIVDPIFNNEF